MKIWSHTLVKNEDRYLWYAVSSVIDYVDKVLLWDTGSQDKTIKIIRELRKRYQDKISFKEVGEITVSEFPRVREEMLRATKAQWFLIVDGDEVWWRDSIKNLSKTVRERGDEYESIVSYFYNVVGDIYHYQPKTASGYEIDSIKGNLTIRAINKKIPGLRALGEHGQQGYFDIEGIAIQKRSKSKRLHIPQPAFMHFTNMPRSSQRSLDLMVPKRKFKYKYEIGIPFPRDFYYPEVFFEKKPDFVDDVWEKMRTSYYLISLPLTLLRRLRRKLLPLGKGY